MKYLVIKGKKYIVKSYSHHNGTSKVELMPYDSKKHKAITDYIVDKLAPNIDKKVLLRQALAPVSYLELKKMEKALKHHAKVKAKEGCYEIQIGKHNYVSLVGA